MDHIISKKWKSELSEYIDKDTGRKVRKFTSKFNNRHFYFYDNSFDIKGEKIFFLSDRASGVEKPSYEHPVWQLFEMNLSDGAMIQLTDEPEGVNAITKTPESDLLLYTTGKKLRLIDMKSGSIKTIFEIPDGYKIGGLTIASNKRYAGFVKVERVNSSPVEKNYSGFADNYYGCKDSRIYVAMLDGSGVTEVFRDTHNIGHFQFDSCDPTIASFCHEGPWNLVTQRMWLIDLISRDVKPCFRQGAQDSVGHEFWTQDGRIIFDNRGPGHDGTITSDRTQAVAKDVDLKNFGSFIPYIGIADAKGNVLRKIEMPWSCNHYHSGPNPDILVGDDIDDIVLVDISTDRARIEKFCHHGTSWITQSAHAHPTWSWDGSEILFASDRDGGINLYCVRV